MAGERIAFDKDVALERLGGDDELLAELAEVYLDDQDAMMSDVEAAVRARDSEALARAAHKLKGAASNFCAEATVAVALRLEEMGRNGDLSDVAASWDELREAVVALTGELKGLAGSA